MFNAIYSTQWEYSDSSTIKLSQKTLPDAWLGNIQYNFLLSVQIDDKKFSKWLQRGIFLVDSSSRKRCQLLVRMKNYNSQKFQMWINFSITSIPVIIWMMVVAKWSQKADPKLPWALNIKIKNQWFKRVTYSNFRILWHCLNRSFFRCPWVNDVKRSSQSNGTGK